MSTKGSLTDWLATDTKERAAQKAKIVLRKGALTAGTDHSAVCGRCRSKRERKRKWRYDEVLLNGPHFYPVKNKTTLKIGR